MKSGGWGAEQPKRVKREKNRRRGIKREESKMAKGIETWRDMDGKKANVEAPVVFLHMHTLPTPKLHLCAALAKTLSSVTR